MLHDVKIKSKCCEHVQNMLSQLQDEIKKVQSRGGKMCMELIIYKS